MPGKPNTQSRNKHHLVIGTSGSGKTSWVKSWALKGPRVIAWDPDCDYDLPRVHSAAALARVLIAAKGGQVKVALSVDPTPARFEEFCRVVWAYICSSRPCVVIAEEIADVTPPGKAGVYWGMLCRRGRKYGAQLVAVTQRPAECDKTIYSQAATKWVGVLDNEIDRKRLAGLLSLRVDDLTALHPLEYYLKETGPAPARKGRVVNPKAKRVAAKKRPA